MNEAVELSKSERARLLGYRIELEVEGATEEDLARGVDAAWAVFDATGVDPWKGAYASHDMEWTPADTLVLTEEDANKGTAYWDATEAALIAACGDLPDTLKKYCFSLVWDDEPPYEPHPLAIEVVFPWTQHGRPADQLGILKPGKRRKLVGWKWEWDE